MDRQVSIMTVAANRSYTEIPFEIISQRAQQLGGKWDRQANAFRCPGGCHSKHKSKSGALMLFPSGAVYCHAGCKDAWKYVYGDFNWRELRGQIHRASPSWPPTPTTQQRSQPERQTPRRTDGPPLPGRSVKQCRDYLRAIDTRKGARLQYACQDGRTAEHCRWQDADGKKQVRNPGMTGPGWHVLIFGVDLPNPLCLAVCEGEKDACRSAIMGIPAIAYPGGANKAAQACYDHAIAWATERDIPIVISADHDHPNPRNQTRAGHEAALAVQRIIPSATILSLDDVPEGGSPTDYADYPDRVRRAVSGCQSGVDAVKDPLHINKAITPDLGPQPRRNQEEWLCCNPYERWARSTVVVGDDYRYTPVPCNVCIACLAWDRHLKIKRITDGGGTKPEATTLRISGKHALNYAKRLPERVGFDGKWVRIIVNEAESLLVYPDGLDPAVIARSQSRARQRGITVALEPEFDPELTPAQRMTEDRRQTVSFSRDWGDFTKPEPDYIAGVTRVEPARWAIDGVEQPWEAEQRAKDSKDPVKGESVVRETVEMWLAQNDRPLRYQDFRELVEILQGHTVAPPRAVAILRLMRRANGYHGPAQLIYNAARSEWHGRPETGRHRWRMCFTTVLESMTGYRVSNQDLLTRGTSLREPGELDAYDLLDAAWDLNISPETLMDEPLAEPNWYWPPIAEPEYDAPQIAAMTPSNPPPRKASTTPHFQRGLAERIQ